MWYEGGLAESLLTDVYRYMEWSSGSLQENFDLQSKFQKKRLTCTVCMLEAPLRFLHSVSEKPLPSCPFFRVVGSKVGADRNIRKKNLSKDHKLSAVLTEWPSFYDSHSLEINRKLH